MRRRHSFVKKAKDFKALKQYKTIMKIQSLLTELEQSQEDFKSEEKIVLDSRNLLEKEMQFINSLREYAAAISDFKTNNGDDKLLEYQNTLSSSNYNCKFAKDLVYYTRYYKSHREEVVKSDLILEEKKGKVNALGEKVENLLKDQPLNDTIPESPKVDECAICLCPYDTENHKHSAITTCGHRFGSSCLNRLSNKRCPICFQRFKSNKVITLY